MLWLTIWVNKNHVTAVRFHLLIVSFKTLTIHDSETSRRAKIFFVNSWLLDQFDMRFSVDEKEFIIWKSVH